MNKILTTNINRYTKRGTIIYRLLKVIARGLTKLQKANTHTQTQKNNKYTGKKQL